MNTSTVPVTMISNDISTGIRVIITVLLPTLVILLRFFYQYRKSRAQFPGPPIKNFWVGNLDETMADNVHEKVLSYNHPGQ